MTPFADRLEARVREVGTAACVGLDPFLDRVPGLRLDAGPDAIAAVVRAFCLDVVREVAPLVAAIKPQSALFEQLGAPGLAALADVTRAGRDAGLVVILDGKRGDIGSTAEAYARAQLDDDGPIGADAATVSPYLGPESLAPYLARSEAGKGMFVLVRTSNPGAAAWQVDTGIAAAVADWVRGCDGLGAVGAVVGATLPAEEVAALRLRMPNAWFLVPGFGAQGAGPDDVRPHRRADGLGALVTSSREVLFGGGAPPRAGDPRSSVAGRAAAFADAVRIR